MVHSSFSLVCVIAVMFIANIIQVDAKKISAAWPTDKGEAPTARAITERLVKIRSNAVKSGLGNFSISSSQNNSASTSVATSRATSSKTPATPARKNTTNPPGRKPATPKTATVSTEENTSASSTPAAATATNQKTSSPPATPASTKKKTATAPGTPASINKKTSPKRKHDAVVKPEPDDDTFITPTPPHPVTPHRNKPMHGEFRGTTMGGHDLADLARNPDLLVTPTNQTPKLAIRQNEMAADEIGSPIKRTKRSASRRVSYASDDDAGADSDASEYDDDEEIAV